MAVESPKKVTHYKELLVWQKAMILAKETYKVTALFPGDERFGLTSQMRRSAVSVPSNIAEGQARQ
jgi:carbamoyl-phosphate synthase large subunit